MKSLEEEIMGFETLAAAEAPIVSLKPARFRAFVRLIRQLVKIHGPRPIRIEKSRIAQPLGSANFVVDINMENLFTDDSRKGDGTPKQGVSLDFQATEEHVRDLLAVASQEFVAVSDRGSEIVFSNGQAEARLFKSMIKAECLTSPLVPEGERVGELVNKVDRAALTSYISKSGYVSLLCYDGQLERVGVRGKSPYTLRKSSVELVSGHEPNQTFTSQHFLSLAGELDFTLGIYRTGQGYWLKTSSKASMIKNLTTYERLYEGRI